MLQTPPKNKTKKKEVEVGKKYKRKIAPNTFEIFEVVDKENGSFITKDEDGNKHKEPFLQTAIEI